MKKKTTNLISIAGATIAIFQISGCAFFSEPLNDPLNNLPPPGTIERQSSQQSPAVTENSEANVISTFLMIAPIEDIPESAGNVAVIHFTHDNTDRALGLCKALTQNLQITDAGDLPATATNVVMWPVANDNAGATCLEMLTDYEPIDISVEASKRVNESAEGPFLLTQNMPTGKRMIFDMSYVSASSLKSAVGEWQTLMGSASDDWPPYRSAR